MIPADQLKPRGATALVDAAIRLCSRNTRVWALTLPAGALLIAALVPLADDIRHHRAPFGTVALFTAAWIVRVICLGAACHSLEALLVNGQAVSAWSSLAQAFRRAPSLVVASAMSLVINLAVLSFTLGFGFLFMGAHASLYAVAMRGQGSALSLYGTSARMLGPARAAAVWVRICGITQVIVAFGLFSAVQQTLAFCESMLGIEVSYAQRFTSLHNPLWVAILCGITFTLYEPIRAATATLLLLDGRIRQEGLDLLAKTAQLPTRKKKSVIASGAIVSVLLLGSPVLAAEVTAASSQRLQQVIRNCEMSDDTNELYQRVFKNELPGSSQSALNRLVANIERLALDEQDCEQAETRLVTALGELDAMEQTSEADTKTSREQAQQVLQRPEFERIDPAKRETVEPEADEPPGWLERLIEDFFKWLMKDREASSQKLPDMPAPGSFGIDGARVVMVLAAIVVLALLVYLVVRSRDQRQPDVVDAQAGNVTVQENTDDPMSALSKPTETWASMADTLAMQGQFREAIRHLYLALLSRLHRDGAIEYDPHRSNWEYVRAFSGPSTRRSIFRELTMHFDFAWYGHAHVDSNGYQQFRATLAPLLMVTPESANA